MVAARVSAVWPIVVVLSRVSLIFQDLQPEADQDSG
jgi:hypothetical protein